MKHRINLAWRTFATGLSFFLFGIGGILIALIPLPLSWLLPKKHRETFAKGTIRKSFRLFVIIMEKLGVLSYRYERMNELDSQGQLILANHPTLIDIVFIIASVPNADCIVKGELLRNPFMRGAINFAGYIANEDPQVVIAKASSSLARGNNLIIFPEGTRSKRDEPLKFLRGAANIAIRTNAPIRPIVIHCSPLSLGKGEPWYHVPDRPMHYNMSVKNRLIPESNVLTDSTLQARKLTRQLQEYFSRESCWHGTSTSRN